MSSGATRVQGRAVGETVSKDELLARVWHGTVVEENNLTQISTLRKVLGENFGRNPRRHFGSGGLAT